MPTTPPNAFFFDWTREMVRVARLGHQAEEALGTELARLGHQDVVHAVATSSPVVLSGMTKTEVSWRLWDRYPALAGVQDAAALTPHQGA